MTRSFRGVWLGRRRYAPVNAFQEKLLAMRQAGLTGDTILFVEHDAVVTFGRGAHTEHLLVPTQTLAELGVDFVRTGRGGDVTLHLPGQLVAYPIRSEERRVGKECRCRRSPEHSKKRITHRAWYSR